MAGSPVTASNTVDTPTHVGTLALVLKGIRCGTQSGSIMACGWYVVDVGGMCSGPCPLYWLGDLIVVWYGDGDP